MISMAVKKVVASVKKAITKKAVVKEKTITPSINNCEKCGGVGRLAPIEFYHMESCDACNGTGIIK